MKEHSISNSLRREISKRFKHYQPTVEQTERFHALRQKGEHHALKAAELCPLSREFLNGLRCLEQASYWFQAAIARNEPADSPTEEVESEKGDGQVEG